MLPKATESTGAADRSRWTQSCHLLEDDPEKFSPVTERYNGNDKDITHARSRSSHAVEKYDALVEKLRSSRAMVEAEQVRFNGKEESPLQTSRPF